MKRFGLLLLLFAFPAFAQDIPLELKGDTTTVKVAKVITTYEDRLVLQSLPALIIAPADIGFYRWTYPATVKATDKGNVLQIDAAPQGDSKVSLKVESAVVENGKVKYVTKFSDIVFSVGVPGPPVPPVPPLPPDPPVPPVPPTPVPVTSFHVIFAWESGKTQPPGVISVMDAKVVRDYLTANTTPDAGFAGWRKYDKDQDSSKDTAVINQMWTAVKPKLTTVPCVAIETNGHVDILPLEATPAAMVETFKKYKGGA